MKPQHRHPPVTLPEPISKSLLDVGNVVMRRQDTSRTGVQVEKATCGRLEDGIAVVILRGGALMSKGYDGRACDSRALLPRDSVLLRLSAACAAFWMNSRAVACTSLSSALREMEVAVSMTSDRRVSRSCSERRPAKTASRIIPWIGLWEDSRTSIFFAKVSFLPIRLLHLVELGSISEL